MKTGCRAGLSRHRPTPIALATRVITGLLALKVDPSALEVLSVSLTAPGESPGFPRIPGDARGFPRLRQFTGGQRVAIIPTRIRDLRRHDTS